MKVTYFICLQHYRVFHTAQAAFLLQNTDKLIKTIPEVDTVFEKLVKLKQQRIQPDGND